MTRPASPKAHPAAARQTWLKGPISADPLAWPWNLLGWEGLPARPAALERAIVRRFEHGHALSSATFAYAAGLLQQDAPPAIRAALYRVIEGLPGISYLGPVIDRLGRPGIGVGLTHGGARQELFFDPVTSRGLEEEIVAVAPEQDGNNYQPAGTVLLYTVFVTSGGGELRHRHPPGRERLAKRQRLTRSCVACDCSTPRFRSSAGVVSGLTGVIQAGDGRPMSRAPAARLSGIRGYAPVLNLTALTAGWSDE
jgi:hypothetical protein